MLLFTSAIALFLSAVQAEPKFGGTQALNSNVKAMQPFETIEHIKNVGIYCWDPTGLPHKRFTDVTVTDVLQGLHHKNCKPDVLIPLDSIPPTTFRNDLPDDRVKNEFPKDPGDIVPLYVAKQRGVDLPSVEFQLGASALHALATRKVDPFGDKYLVQRCPTTGIIILTRSNKYEQNHAERSFQFKRVLAGRGVAEEHAQKKFENLQLIKVAGYTALIAADVHLVDDSMTPVEAKTADPKFFGLKVMLKMLSVGAKTIVMPRPRKPAFDSVATRTFEDLVQEHSPIELAIAESNIREALEFLKGSSEIIAEAPAELDFTDGKLRLLQCPPACGGDDLLPSPRVVAELLGLASVPTEIDLEEVRARLAVARLSAERDAGKAVAAEEIAARAAAAVRRAVEVAAFKGSAAAFNPTVAIRAASLKLATSSWHGPFLYTGMATAFLLLCRWTRRHGHRDASALAGAPLLAADQKARRYPWRGLHSTS